MPPDQLFRHLRRNLFEVKPALLPRDLRVHDHLQQQIPQFLLEMRIVPGVDRLDHLIHLLDGARPQARMRLLPVPRAAIRRPQLCHDVPQPRHLRQRRARFSGFNIHRAIVTLRWLYLNPSNYGNCANREALPCLFVSLLEFPLTHWQSQGLGNLPEDGHPAPRSHHSALFQKLRLRQQVDHVAPHSRLPIEPVRAVEYDFVFLWLAI